VGIIKIWQIKSLRIRIYVVLIGLVFITMAGGAVTIGYTFRIERILTLITNRDMAAFQKAEALETALINQKGFVSYYFIEGDPEWLRQLGEYRRVFKELLEETFSMAETQAEKDALAEIEAGYNRYVTLKDRVIGYYQGGERENGKALHQEVRSLFFTVIESFEKYKHIHENRIWQAKTESVIQAARLRIVAAIAVFVSFMLMLLLAFVLGNQVLGPVRRLTAEVSRESDSLETYNEVNALSHGVRGLLQNVDQTQTELQKSRETLLQAEKMAMVGKLAAGMAHSIRNPFTSVKMRLFSLSRSLELTSNQIEDFEVISEEIRHIDTIIQNFLEFSRPPKLKIQTISPSVVVDRVIQLLEHRLKSYNVRVQIKRDQMLPAIDADPEQLKELLVNIVVNACEAMTAGGSIVISEEVKQNRLKKHQAIIRISDSGPGIPESIQNKVFLPFFTTKEEGTGLGLSIASRIVKDHNGRLDVESMQGEGAIFTIRIPVREIHDE
jgi:signal transduction histidine kinase